MDTENTTTTLSEVEQLKKDNEFLLNELKDCHDTLNEQIALLTSLKRNMQRYEVQINSLKNENNDLKNKFAKIENNPLGSYALKIYRWLREIKHRIAE